LRDTGLNLLPKINIEEGLFVVRGNFATLNVGFSGETAATKSKISEGFSGVCFLHCASNLWI